MTTTAMEHLLRNMIGIDPLLNRFGSAQTNYPPHNIEKLGDDHYRLTLAVAGFTADDLSLTLQHGILTITGQKADEETPGVALGPTAPGQYLYRGIALRDFRREFRLGEDVEVADAKLDHGLLVVDLIRELPEAQKPKLIPIR